MSKQARLKRAKHLNEAFFKFANRLQQLEGLKLPICTNSRESRRLLTTRQAAKLLGRKKHTLENWRSIGVGPSFHKVGGRIFYNKDDLQRFLKERKLGSTSEYCTTSFGEERK